MKQLSFRLRIALLSALLSGSALVGFGVVSWWLIYQANLNRIDDSIKDQLLRESDRLKPDSHWPFYALSLSEVVGNNTPDSVVLLVQTPTGKTIYHSPTWTPALTRVTFFPSALPMSSPSRQSFPSQVPPPHPGSPPGNGMRRHPEMECGLLSPVFP